MSGIRATTAAGQQLVDKAAELLVSVDCRTLTRCQLGEVCVKHLRPVLALFTTPRKNTNYVKQQRTASHECIYISVRLYMHRTQTPRFGYRGKEYGIRTAEHLSLG